jgi:CheY-like chemotaxis protein
MFAGSEFDVVSVSNGDAAVRKFEEVHPDLILADIYMPGKNGYEVCAAVKKHPELGDTPVVLLAGAFDAFDHETASQVGAAHHITKPFEPQALLNLVSSLAPKESRPRTAPAPAPAPAPAAAMAASAPVPVAIPATPWVSPVLPSPADIVRDEVKPLAIQEEKAAVLAEPLALAPQPVPAPAPVVEELPKEEVPAAAKPAAVESSAAPADSSDLLGLQDLFKPPASTLSVSDAEIDRIAQLVIQKLSTQVIENVAWDVVPDITTKVLKEELKRKS